MQVQKKDNIIRCLMKAKRIGFDELSSKTGLSLSTLHRVIGGSHLDPRMSTLKPLADFFNLSFEELLGLKHIKKTVTSDSDVLSNQDAVRHVPILHWEQLSRPLDIGHYNFNTWDHWAIANNHVSEQSFALKIEGDSLQPRFSNNTIVIIDPQLEAEDNDYVLCENNDELFIAQLHKNGLKKYYRCLMSNNLMVSREVCVKGVVSIIMDDMISKNRG